MNIKHVALIASLNALLWTGCTIIKPGNEQRSKLMIEPFIPFKKKETTNRAVKDVNPLTFSEFSILYQNFSKENDLEDAFLYDNASQTVSDVGYNHTSGSVTQKFETIVDIIEKNDFQGDYYLVHNHPGQRLNDINIKKMLMEKYKEEPFFSNFYKQGIFDVVFYAGPSIADLRSHCEILEILRERAEEKNMPQLFNLYQGTSNGWATARFQIKNRQFDKNELIAQYDKWDQEYMSNKNLNEFTSPRKAIQFINRSAQSLLNETSGTLDLDFRWGTLEEFY